MTAPYNSYRALFSRLEQPALPQNLNERIIMRVERVRRRRTLMRAWAFGAASGASAAACAYLIANVAISFRQSGFFQYLALAFSGDGMVFSYWKELSLSLLESLPIYGTLCILAVLVFLLWSAAQAAAYVRSGWQFRNSH